MSTALPAKRTTERGVRAARGIVIGSLLVGAAVASFGCKRFQRKHIPVESVQELGYPTCQGAALPAGETLGGGRIRSGPNHPDQHIDERYTLARRGCVMAMTVRQQWPLGTADVEVLYDEELRPLRIWKRMTLPGTKDPEKSADVRRYELRTDPVEIKRKNPDGRVDYERLLGGRPLVVIGPGRGLLSAWIRRARLGVGEKVRELAIDVRGLEVIEPVTLLREADMTHPVLGPVQVYTFYGRETVFADAQGFVVGDLAGLLPHALLETPPPPALPSFGPLDPVHSP